MKWPVLQAAAATLLANAASASYVQDQGIPVEKTVTLENGQVIDWIKRDVQGDIAQPPAPIRQANPMQRINLSNFNETTTGPEGTVPVPRSDKKLPQTKVGPPRKTNRHTARQYAGTHWYSSTNQAMDSHGSHAALSMYNAYVANSGDFSLLQTAIVRENTPQIGRQTVEAGWINYPDQVARPHLFSFYTTNNYEGYGDYVSGWNTEYRGWVQYDNTYYPGMELSPLATVGGSQHEVGIQYKLESGNWWLGVNGKWIGYYPANMFVTKGNAAGSTLADHATDVAWYGEIYQSEGPMTTTDMGSGHFANEGYGKAAFIRQIQITDTNGNDSAYDGSQGLVVSDPQRYSIDPHFNSGSDWGSYFFLGGPGAGGVIGG